MKKIVLSLAPNLGHSCRLFGYSVGNIFYLLLSSFFLFGSGFFGLSLELGAADFQFCKTQDKVTLSTGQKLPRCMEFFPSPPFIHLPEDKNSANSEQELYAAVNLLASVNLPGTESHDKIFTRSGKGFAIHNPATGTPFDSNESMFELEHLRPILSSRTTNTIFRIRGILVQSNSPSGRKIDAIEVKEVEPILIVSEDLLERALLGSYRVLIPLLDPEYEDLNEYNYFSSEQKELCARFDKLSLTQLPKELKTLTLHDGLFFGPNKDTQVQAILGRFSNWSSASAPIFRNHPKTHKPINVNPLKAKQEGLSVSGEVAWYRKAHMHGSDYQLLTFFVENSFIDGGGMGGPTYLFHPMRFIQTKAVLPTTLSFGHHSPYNFMMSFEPLPAGKECPNQ